MNHEERQAKFIAEHPKHVYSQQFISRKREQNRREEIILKTQEKNRLKEEKQLEARRSYLEELVILRNSGKTLRECGDAYGFTRERARQLLGHAENLGMAVKHYAKPPKEMELRTCTCGVAFNACIHTAKKYCSKKCSVEAQRKYHSREEILSAIRERQKRRYHTDPEYRAMYDKAQKKYYLKTKDDPGKKAKNKIYTKRWRERHTEKHIAWRKEYWRRNKERLNAYQRRRYAMSKLKK